MPDSSAAADVRRLLNGRDDYSDRLLSEYMLNFIQLTDLRSASAYRLCYEAERVGDIDGFPVEASQDEKGKAVKKYPFKRTPPKDGVCPKDWKKLEAYFSQRMQSIEAPDNEPVDLQNLMKLFDCLGFDAFERRAARALYVLSSHSQIRDLFSALAPSPLAAGALISCFLKDLEHYQEYTQVISKMGRLYQYGILGTTSNHDAAFLPEIDAFLLSRLGDPNLSHEDMIGLVVGKPVTTALVYEDFAYLGPKLGIIRDALANISPDDPMGAPIFLFYGPAGVGKTELAKALAQVLGKKLYAIGEEKKKAPRQHREVIVDSRGMRDSFSESGFANLSTEQLRMTEFNRAQRLLASDPDAMIFVDEAEDLGGAIGLDGQPTPKSKVLLNRLLENQHVPTILCINDPQKFGPHFKQRFLDSLFVDRPPVLVRERVWRRQAESQGVSFSDAEFSKLARTYDAAPRQMAAAIRMAKLSGRGLDAIALSLPASALLTNNNKPSIFDSSSVLPYFNPDLLVFDGKSDMHTPFSLPEVIARGQAGNPLSLMVQGDAGTGVRSLPRYMAERMQMNVSEYSMANLCVSDSSGDPASKMRKIFAHAASYRRFLVVHDVENLVSGAKNKAAWENNALVDTFVSHAQRHSLPFAVTSQADMEYCSDSFLFHFSDVACLGALSQKQAQQAFLHYFGQEAPAAINEIEGLRIGDFSQVGHLLAKLDTSTMFPDDVVALLKRKRAMRGNESSSIGFGAGKSRWDAPVEGVGGLHVAAKDHGAIPISETFSR